MNHAVVIAPTCFSRKARMGTLALITLSLGACSVAGLKTPWSGDEVPTANADHVLISKNLLDTVAQYPRYNPLLATVQVSPADSPFEQQMHLELAERGYKLESVEPGEGDNEVNAVISSINEDLYDASLYTLSIGKITAERSFARVDGDTLPVSEMVIRGAEERALILNDAELFASADSTLGNVRFEPYAGPALGAALTAPIDNAVPGAPERIGQNAVRHNLYDTMESNYSDVLTDYEEIDQSVLVFPNDSLRLGDVNKKIIEQYVSQMDPQTDVLSVIGCSLGKTTISNGNSLLALGRANRVKEALLFSGIQHDLVMEEGCWAPVTFDDVMPRRGVLLTLKRRKNS